MKLQQKRHLSQGRTGTTPVFIAVLQAWLTDSSSTEAICRLSAMRALPPHSQPMESVAKGQPLHRAGVETLLLPTGRASAQMRWTWY